MVIDGFVFTSTSFSSDGPMSHWEAITVTHAFKRAENAGKGLENITAKLAGSHEGNNDFNTRLLRRGIGLAWEARETNTLFR